MKRLVCILNLTYYLFFFPVVAVAQNPADLIPGQFLVTFRADAPPVMVAAELSRKHGFAVRHVYRFALRGMAIEVPRGTEQIALRALRRDPRVRTLGHDRYIHFVGQNVPTGVNRINAEPNIGTNTGHGVRVAIVDTGLDFTHPDLATNINTALSVNCVGGGGCNPGGQDNNGHGTGVGGIVAAVNNTVDVVGVGPQIELVAVKVLDANGSGSFTDVIAGLDYLTWLNQSNEMINVANMSLGAACADCTDNSTDPTIAAFHTAVRGLVNAGTTVVVAAGNSSADASSSVPASFDEVITVSAMGDSDGLPGSWGEPLCLFWFFDCFAPLADDSFALTAFGFSNFGPDIDVIAPGVGIPLLNLGGGTVTCNFVNLSTCSGTSFSSPHAAGVAALFIRDRLNKSEPAPFPGTVRQALIETGECYEGAGMIFHGTAGCSQVWPNDPDGIAEPLVRGDNIANFPSASVHDAAVTSISPPPLAVTNSTYQVLVGVENRGTGTETFDLSMSDNLFSIISNTPQTITLAAGASDTVSFDWTPTAAGNHVLTATASGVPGDADPSNDSKQAAFTVSDPTHDVAVTAISAPTPVPQGNMIDISVGLANKGTFDETFTVLVTVTPPTGGTTGMPISPQNVTLVPGASTTLTFVWDTTGASTGDHTLTADASLGAVTDDQLGDNSQSTLISLVAPSHDVALTSIISQSIVTQGDNLGISVTVANQGTFSETFDILMTDIPPQNGTPGTWASPNPQTVTLGPGLSNSSIFVWETTTASGGDHILRATAGPVIGEADSADNEMDKVVNVSALIHDVAILSVTARDPVTENEIVDVFVEVANEGTVQMTVTFQLDDFPPSGGNSGTVSAPQSVTLSPGEIQTLTFTWDTTGATVGIHTLSSIFSPVDSDSDPLDNTSVISSTVLLAAPSGLTAGADASVSGRGKNKVKTVWVELSWTDNSSSEESYVIERCEVVVNGRGRNKSTSCTYNFSLSVAANSVSYHDGTVASGTTYRYRVKGAHSVVGDSPYSSEVEAKTP